MSFPKRSSATLEKAPMRSYCSASALNLMISVRVRWRRSDKSFASYEDVSGLKLPRRLLTTLDRFFQTDFYVTWNTVDSEIGDLAAPASVVNATQNPPRPPALVAEQVPGTTGMWKIWVEQGEVRPDQRPDTNATCLMELSDHMVLFDVPGPDAFVQAVIAKAKELRPNKPITQLVLSHFDPGHTAGLRAGSRPKIDRQLTGGASASAARTRATKLPSVSRGRPVGGAVAGCAALTPSRRTSGPRTSSGTIASRIRHGYGTMVMSRRRNSESPADRSYLRSIWARVASISGAYCTPEGHAVTHDRHPRQASKC